VRSFDGAEVAALGPAAAVRAIVDALRAGLDPAADPARSAVELANGQFLLMPSETASATGVKVVTVNPGNAERDLPRIEGTYLLYDRDTLSLRALLDGTALTTLRTPAVSVAAVLDHLPDRPLRVAVAGTGPQGAGHVATLAAFRELAEATYLVRNATGRPDAVVLGSGAADDVLRRADVVVCATSAREPFFDSAVLRDDVVVVAVGSHEPEARELDAALLARASVVVEDVETALREAGDVIQAIDEGALTRADLLGLSDVVTGRARVGAGRPLVFKSVGMSWEDLVVAEAIVAAGRKESP
jgi:ornithine cyclodeaminase